MSIWNQNPTIEEINQYCKETMVDHLDISITKVLDNSLEGVMKISNKVKQPFGIVHGGANCVLAETLGSLAANLVLDTKKQHAVGLSITTNHIKAVRNGEVRGVAKPKHIGKKTQVWEIETFNQASEITSLTSLTMAVIEKL